MGRRGHRFFLGGGVVRCRCVVKEKSPDLRSPEVGISATNITPFQPNHNCKQREKGQAKIRHKTIKRKDGYFVVTSNS